MFKKLLIGLGAVFLLIIVIGAISGGGSDSTSADEESISGTNEDTAEPATEDAGDTKEPAKEEPAAEESKPAGNTVGNWTILNKPKFGQEYGMFKSVDLRVQNTSDSEDDPWLEIRLTNGNDLVTTFDCIGQTVRPGETTTLECSSLDDFRKFTDYEILNAF
ncbi:hypothetical protein [Nocardioides mesophilus]|uniref:Uncharacterized protein n=1 Tax=Nocardioides mesophilus TaxID=433659 RepID=A0A7G9RC57_9ACTN|nr:hypothetical protein [Nocardioides mesophilus]QNN53182.1 hypothetical protein H9L09_01420 [Nocardioides mesophilus]